MTEYVVFTKTNARIVKNPSPVEFERIDKGLVILKNPERSTGSHPPHYWKPDISSNKVLVMTEDEMLQRDADSEEHGYINNIYHSHYEKPKPEYLKPQIPIEKSWLEYNVFIYGWLLILTLLYIWSLHV